MDVSGVQVAVALKGMLRELHALRDTTEDRVKAAAALSMHLAKVAGTILQLERMRGKSFVYDNAALHEIYTLLLQRLVSDVRTEEELQRQLEKEQEECAILHDHISQVSRRYLECISRVARRCSSGVCA